MQFGRWIQTILVLSAAQAGAFPVASVRSCPCERNSQIEDFRDLVQHGELLFENAIQLMENGDVSLPSPVRIPMNEKVQQLMEQRRLELAKGMLNNEQSVRKKLSELKTVVEQFHLIYSNLEEEIKIIFQIKGIRPPVLQTAEQN